MTTAIFRHPTNTNVKQEWRATVDSATSAETFIVTLTDDDGNTEVVTFTVDSEANETEVAEGFVALWNASVLPLVASITASNDGPTVILTADVAGVPFSAAASGTGTWANDGNTIANVGNNDYGTARNWSTNAAPEASDDVVIPPGNVNLSYGLNQSGVAVDDFFVSKGAACQLGRLTRGVAHYLRIDPNSLRYEGSGNLVLLDIGSANISPYIAAEGSQSAAGLKTVYLKGSDIDVLDVLRGTVGVAVLPGETATVATIRCGFLESPQSDVDLEVGSGVTLTTLVQSGGRCVLRCAATTVTVSRDGTLQTEGTGAITTLNVSGSVQANSTGTIGTANVGGLLDLSGNRAARTITTVNMLPGGRLIIHSGITITTLNVLAANGSFTIERV